MVISNLPATSKNFSWASSAWLVQRMRQRQRSTRPICWWSHPPHQTWPGISGMKSSLGWISRNMRELRNSADLFWSFSGWFQLDGWRLRIQDSLSGMSVETIPSFLADWMICGLNEAPGIGRFQEVCRVFSKLPAEKSEEAKRPLPIVPGRASLGDALLLSWSRSCELELVLSILPCTHGLWPGKLW